MTLGGYNLSDTSGPVTWNPLVRTDYWSVALSEVYMGDWKMNLTSTEAMIDTGTSYVVIP